MKNAANGQLSTNVVAPNNVEPGCIKTRSSRMSGDSAPVKNLIDRASGSSASEPEDIFSYFVAGKTICVILGYNAAATSERTRASLEEYFDSFEMSADDVDGMRPASCNDDI